MKAILKHSCFLILYVASTGLQFVNAKEIDFHSTNSHMLFSVNDFHTNNDLRTKRTDSIPKSEKLDLKKPYDSNYSFQSESKRNSYLKSLKVVGLIHTFSLVYLFSASKEKTNWQYDFGPELFRNAGRNLHKALTRWPAWDNDPFITNYLQHPYAGSIYYNLVRNRGVSVLGSFEFAIIGSSIFEFFIEAMFEQPSIQDLFATPVFGALIGEASHQLTLKMSNHGFNIIEKIIVLIINPAYVWNHGYRVPTMQKKKELQQMRKRKPENVFR